MKQHSYCFRVSNYTDKHKLQFLVLPSSIMYFRTQKGNTSQDKQKQNTPRNTKQKQNKMKKRTERKTKTNK